MQNHETVFSHEVEVIRVMATTPETVWSVLAQLARLAEWAPGIDGAHVVSDKNTGIGAVRKVATAQFGEIEQHVTDWEDGQTLAYVTADSGPFSKTLTRYDIRPMDDKTHVTVRLAFDVKPGTMPIEQAKAALDQGLTGTLKALEMQARLQLADG